MNCELKGNIVKVKKGVFTSPTTGEIVNYCSFYLLVLGPTTETETGYDYEKFNCKVDNYNKIIELIKSNKPVTIKVDMIRQIDGNYKRRAIKIDDMSL